jgi:hypothetical protein
MTITPRTAGFLTVRHIGRAPDIGDDQPGEHYAVGEANVIQTDKRHFSISCPHRDPTWEEVASARYALLPKGRDCVMVLPPEWEYVNLHEYCFHVHLLRNLAPGGRFHNPESW